MNFKNVPVRITFQPREVLSLCQCLDNTAKKGSFAKNGINEAVELAAIIGNFNSMIHKWKKDEESGTQSHLPHVATFETKTWVALMNCLGGASVSGCVGNSGVTELVDVANCIQNISNSLEKCKTSLPVIEEKEEKKE